MARIGTHRTSGSQSGLSRTLAAAAVAAAVGLASSPALAQGGRGEGQRTQVFQTNGMGMGRMMQSLDPVMTTRDLPKYADILKLTPEQQELAGTLLDAYQTEVNTKRAELQETLRAAREEGGEDRAAAWEGIRESMEKSRVERRKTDEAFLADFKSLLSPEQEANWPRFERTHRREKQLGRGFISGERMDVIELVNDAKLPEEAQEGVKPILSQYEEALDRELINREKVQADLMERIRQAGPGGDPGAMQGAIEEGREASVRVRDINRRFARQVQEALPEEHQFEFARAVKQASFPDIYRETHAKRVITTAAGLAGIDESQRQGLQAIQQNYDRDLAVLNDKLAAAQEEMEMNFNVERMRQGGGRDLGPLGDLRRQKRELENATEENVRKLLTPEQQERLPKREERGGRDGRGGRGGDGRGEGRGSEASDAGETPRPRSRRGAGGG